MCLRRGVRRVCECVEVLERELSRASSCLFVCGREYINLSSFLPLLFSWSHPHSNFLRKEEIYDYMFFCGAKPGSRISFSKNLSFWVWAIVAFPNSRILEISTAKLYVFCTFSFLGEDSCFQDKRSLRCLHDSRACVDSKVAWQSRMSLWCFLLDGPLGVENTETMPLCFVGLCLLRSMIKSGLKLHQRRRMILGADSDFICICDSLEGGDILPGILVYGRGI